MSDLHSYIKCGDCVELMRELEDNSIDLVVTSPPYDKLRTYNGNITQWCFEKFRAVATELHRVVKDGGVIVWVVSDETKNGGETLTSFKQALFFQKKGFSVETMIWEKPSFTATGALKYRYGQVFEYMFVLTKGTRPKTFNPIKDRVNVSFGRKKTGTIRQRNDSTRAISSIGKDIQKFGQRFNVWRINPVMSNKKRLHPAQFPENLAHDHIISWSNEGEVVLDPFMGSGTTCLVAFNTNRHFIGFELEKEYFEIASKRLEHTGIEVKEIDE